MGVRVTILDDAQDRLGVTHLAYLLVLGPRSDLPPFAMWPAFPASDYYEGSVALGVAPEGQSRAALIRHVLARFRSPTHPYARARCPMSLSRTTSRRLSDLDVESRHVNQRCSGVS